MEGLSLGLEGGLFLCKFLLASLLCHWVVGRRGLLHQYLLAGAMKWAVLLARSGECFAVMERRRTE
jgi:hypothetical protein